MLEVLQSPRSIALASVACLAAGAIACGSEPAATLTAEPSGAPVVVAGGPPGVAVAPPSTSAFVPDDVAPAHGGTIVMAGSHPVEVIPHASGEVYAYVLGDSPPPPDGTELTVVVPVAGGVRPVELVWDAGETRWGGRVRHDEIVAGPIDVVLVVGGSRWVGHVATFVVLPAIVVVDPSPSVVVIEHQHGKHRKHRGRGRGRGHGRVVHWR